MEFNVCGTCGAGDGRAGILFGHVGSDVNDCENCRDSKLQKACVVHTHLQRTDFELGCMFSAITLLAGKPIVGGITANPKAQVMFDVARHPLAIGDKVATNRQGYTCSLVIGTIIGFTTKKVRIGFQVSANGPIDAEVDLKFPEQVCFVRPAKSGE